VLPLASLKTSRKEPHSLIRAVDETDCEIGEVCRLGADVLYFAGLRRHREGDWLGRGPEGESIGKGGCPMPPLHRSSADWRFARRPPLIAATLEDLTAFAKTA
jgi:hypothetical protein